MTQPEESLEGPIKAVAEHVRRLRQARDWSAERLADEMSRAGVPWKRSIVANLENGRRRVLDVREWLTLASVLDIAPLALLLPWENDAEVVITASEIVAAESAYRWIVGVRPVPGETDPPNPFRWGSRTETYRRERPSYMARSPEEDPDLRARMERQEQLLAELQASLVKITSLNEGSEDGDQTN